VFCVGVDIDEGYLLFDELVDKLGEVVLWFTVDDVKVVELFGVIVNDGVCL